MKWLVCLIKKENVNAFKMLTEGTSQTKKCDSVTWISHVHPLYHYEGGV